MREIRRIHRLFEVAMDRENPSEEVRRQLRQDLGAELLLFHLRLLDDASASDENKKEDARA